MTHPTLAFIGAGNMATAIIRGLLNADYDPQNIYATDAHEPALRAAGELGIQTLTDNSAAVALADIIILAVKPQMARDVLEPLAGAFQGKTLVSICAGLPVSFFTERLGDVAIVRTMPNTPALVGKGATGLFANPAVDDATRDQVAEIFNAAGLAKWVEQEDLIDAVTAASGSGPAYFFALIESMIEGGIELGLDRETATALVCQTAAGAAEMTLTETATPAELRARVTSQGGTTAAALEHFANGQFDATIRGGMRAAYDRAKTLAQQS